MDRRALAGALDLVADLFESGFTRGVREQLRAAGLLPESEVFAGSDEIAADHEAILGFAVLPQAGVFLTAKGFAGSATLADLLPGRQLAAVDGSLVSEVRLMARLVQEEPELAARVAGGHSLGWTPAFGHALRRHPAERYAEVADVLVELLLMAACKAEVDSLSLHVEDRPLRLDLSDTGVRDIARFLVRHALTGVYIGRATIGRIARETGVPRGFGAAGTTLENLLRSGSQFGEFDRVVEALNEEANSYESMWHGRAQRHPILSSWAALWVRRIARTKRLLSRLAQAGTTPKS